MSISIDSTNSVQMNTETSVAVKTAILAKGQQELVGEMALELIQSADINNLKTSSANIGSQINIKV